MLMFTPEELRRLADQIENEHKYYNGENYVLLTVEKLLSGADQAEFEQPCIYRECSSRYYRKIG
jgi:hypothetical protein